MRGSSCQSSGAGDLLPGPAGIRAQALAPDGALVDDFVFEGDDRCSTSATPRRPGATSSLAIGEEIVSRVLQGLGLTPS